MHSSFSPIKHHKGFFPQLFSLPLFYHYKEGGTLRKWTQNQFDNNWKWTFVRTDWHPKVSPCPLLKVNVEQLNFFLPPTFTIVTTFSALSYHIMWIFRTFTSWCPENTQLVVILTVLQQRKKKRKFLRDQITNGRQNTTT